MNPIFPPEQADQSERLTHGPEKTADITGGIEQTTRTNAHGVLNVPSVSINNTHDNDSDISLTTVNDVQHPADAAMSSTIQGPSIVTHAFHSDLQQKKKSIKESINQGDVIKNLQLKTMEERYAKAQELIPECDIDSDTPKAIERKEAIEFAHEVEKSGTRIVDGEYEPFYTPGDLREKMRFLTAKGSDGERLFTVEQADLLLRMGVCGMWDDFKKAVGGAASASTSWIGSQFNWAKRQVTITPLTKAEMFVTQKLKPQSEAMTLTKAAGGGVVNTTAVSAAIEFIKSFGIPAGGNFLSKVGLPSLGAFTPLITVKGREKYANIKYAPAIDEAYTEILDVLSTNATNLKQPPQAEVDKFMKGCTTPDHPTPAEIAVFQKRWNSIVLTPAQVTLQHANAASWKDVFEDKRKKDFKKSMRQNSRIDQYAEKRFVEIMADKAGCTPDKVPELWDLELLEKYCFVRFTDVCAELSLKQGSLTSEEQDIISQFHVEAIDLQTTDSTKAAEVLHQMMDVCNEYAKLILSVHTKARRSELISQSVGGAIGAGLTLGLPGAIVGGVTGLGVQGYLAYKDYRNAPKNLKFGSDGKLEVTTNIQKKVHDPKGLYHQNIFDLQTVENPEHEYWKGKDGVGGKIGLSRIVLEDLKKGKFKDVQELAIELAPSANASLSGVALNVHKATQEEKDKAEESYKKEEMKLLELQSKKNSAVAKKARKEKDLKVCKSNPSLAGKELDIQEEIDECEQQILGLEPQIKAQEKIEQDKLSKLNKLLAGAKPLVLLGNGQDNSRFDIDSYPDFYKTTEQEKAENNLAASRKKLAALESQFSAYKTGYPAGDPTASDIAALKTALDSSEKEFHLRADYEDAKNKYDTAFAELPVLKKDCDTKFKRYDKSFIHTIPGRDPALKAIYEAAQNKLDSANTELPNLKARLDAAAKLSPYLKISINVLETEYLEGKKKYETVSQYIEGVKEVKDSETTVESMENDRKKKVEAAFQTIREAFSLKVKEEWEKQQKIDPGIMKSIANAAREKGVTAGRFVAGEAVMAGIVGLGTAGAAAAGGALLGAVPVASQIIEGLVYFAGGTGYALLGAGALGTAFYAVKRVYDTSKSLRDAVGNFVKGIKTPASNPPAAKPPATPPATPPPAPHP